MAPPRQSRASDAQVIQRRDARFDLLSLGVAAPLPPGGRAPVHEQFAALARSEPSRVAVECAEDAVDYGGLDKWSDRIAARLTALDIGPGQRVAVCVPPSIGMVAATLGVLKTGAAYVPIDPSLPEAKINERLQDAKVRAAAVARSTQSLLVESTLPLVTVDALTRDERSPLLHVAVDPESPAYLIYTSGSAGEPKGVVVSHRQLSASTLARHCVYSKTPAFLLVSPLAFDSSAAGLWGTLTSGGRLIVATSQEVRDPTELIRVIQQNQPTHFLTVPSLYNILLDAAERAPDTWRSSLEAIILAGEPLHETTVQRHFHRSVPSIPLFNEYGPTEATVWASYRRFDGPAPVTIGRPIPGARLYVLDDQLQPVPPGVVGELYIGGSTVACGYFGRPEATARVFLKDPFSDADEGRMYRTGDLARWTGDGFLEFHGRRDHQVKIRGHRVEMGAVEAALKAIDGVREAVVVLNRARAELAGFVLASNCLTESAIRTRLARHVPDAMIPAIIRILDQIPLTLSGKADRARLQSMANEEEAQPTGPSATELDAIPLASDDCVSNVRAAWAEVLGLTEIPSGVNFFDLGGHSLQVFKLQEALERHAGACLSIVDLYRHTTVSGQAKLILKAGTGPENELDSRGKAAAVRGVRALRARRARAGDREAR